MPGRPGTGKLVSVDKYATEMSINSGKSEKKGILQKYYLSEAEPDLELKRRPSFNLLAQPAFLPSVISSLFTQNKEGARAPWALP